MGTFLLASAFFQVVWGLSIVNPANYRWMLAIQGDLTLYLTSTNYYRFSAWQFPITGFDTMLHPVGASIALADGLPLFAIPFKLLDPILPRQILQYFGIWFLICVWLEAWIAKSIFRTLQVSPALQWAGTLLVLADLPLVVDIWHAALWGHWTFLFGFYLFLQPELRVRRTTLLAAVMPWIHPYLTVMAWATLLATFIRHRRSPRILRGVLLALGGAFLSLWLVGYFSFLDTRAGFTGIAVDLAGFFDPGEGRSSLLPQLMPTRPFSDEGFAYLGIGGILLLILLVSRPFVARLRAQPLGVAPLLVVCILMGIYSVGPAPTFRGHALSVPAIVSQLADPISSRLRVSGRFIWPMWHFVLIFGVVTLQQLFPKRSWTFGAAAGLVALQFLDVGPWLVTVRRHTFDYPGLAQVPEAVRSQLTDKSEYLLFHPSTICKGKRSPRYRGTWPLALFGAAHRLKTNSDFHALARPPSFKAVCRFTRRMWKRQARHPEVIYVDPRFVPME